MFETIKAYDDLIKANNKVIRTLKIYPKVFEDEKFKYLHSFFDRNLYNALCLLDLIIGLKYLDMSQAVRNQIESNYFARIIAHSAFEILNYPNKLIGKEVRDYVIKTHSQDRLNEIDNDVKGLNQIKKKNYKYLKAIRHNLFGHKMMEGHKQASMMVKIDYLKVYKIGNQVYNQQSKLLKSLTNLIEHI